MVMYTIVVLFGWFGSISALFWAASWQEEDTLVDVRDQEARRKATESSFFLRG